MTTKTLDWLHIANDEKNGTIMTKINNLPASKPIPWILAICPFHPSDMGMGQNLLLPYFGESTSMNFSYWNLFYHPVDKLLIDLIARLHMISPFFPMFGFHVWSSLAPHHHIAQLQPLLDAGGRRDRSLGIHGASADVFAETLNGDQLHLHVLGISGQS